MARPSGPGRVQNDGPPPAFGSAHTSKMAAGRSLQVQPHAQTVGVLPAVQSLLYVLVVALFLMTFTVQPIRIPSSSMEPTLLVGDFLLLDKQAVASDAFGLMPPAGIARGDVVVFHDPVDDPSVHLVKRVIGLPGDRLHLRDGVVYLNGKALTESYAVHRPAGRDTFRDDFPLLESRDADVNPNWWVRLRSLVHGGELTVPQQSYFVMGDNRNDSEDSRYWGFVPRDAIVGKPVLIYFSLKQGGSLKQDGTERTEDAAPDPRFPALGSVDVRDPGRTSHGGNNSLNNSPTDFARWDRTFRVVR